MSERDPRAEPQTGDVVKGVGGATRRVETVTARGRIYWRAVMRSPGQRAFGFITPDGVVLERGDG